MFLIVSAAPLYSHLWHVGGVPPPEFPGGRVAPQTPFRNLGLAGTGTGHGPCPCKPYVPYRILGVFYLEGVIFIRVFCWLGGLAVLD